MWSFFDQFVIPRARSKKSKNKKAPSISQKKVSCPECGVRQILKADKGGTGVSDDSERIQEVFPCPFEVCDRVFRHQSSQSRHKVKNHGYGPPPKRQDNLPLTNQQSESMMSTQTYVLDSPKSLQKRKINGAWNIHLEPRKYLKIVADLESI